MQGIATISGRSLSHQKQTLPTRERSASLQHQQLEGRHREPVLHFKCRIQFSKLSR